MYPARIGELLKKYGYVTDKQLEITDKIKKIYPNKLFGEILKELYFVSSTEIAKVLSLQSGKPYINLDEVYPSEEALKAIPKDMAMQFKFIPISIDSQTITVVVEDPYNIVMIDLIKKRTNRNVDIFVAEEEKIMRSIQIYYYLLENPLYQRHQNLINKLNQENLNNVLPEIVDFIITEAII